MTSVTEAPSTPTSANEAMAHMRRLEAATHPSAIMAAMEHSMASVDSLPESDDGSPAVTERVRVLVIDWLTKAAARCHLSNRTLHVAVALFDRVLIMDPGVRSATVQLFATACLMIGSKLEEPKDGDAVIPGLRTCAHELLDGHFDTKSLRRAEIRVANTVKFRLCVPSSLTFALLTLEELGIDAGSDLAMLTQYALEIAFYNADLCLAYVPSVIACAAIIVAKAGLIREALPRQENVRSEPLTLADAATRERLWPTEYAAAAGMEDRDAAVLTAARMLSGTAALVATGTSRARYVFIKYASPAWNGVATRHPLTGML